MPKQIIILDTHPLTGGSSQVRTVLWFPVPTARVMLDPGATSAYKGVSTAELAEIQAGRVVEEPFSHTVSAGQTALQVKAQLQAVYTNRLGIFNARPDPRQFYGLAFDGTTWA